MLRTTIGGPELAPLRFVQTVGHQWSTALWPSRTAPMYAIENVAQLDPTRTAAFIVYLLVCVWLLRARRGLAFAGALGFVVWLIPASNLVPLYFPLQDRYLSLPLFALGLALAGDLAQSQRRSALQLLGFAIVACLAARTVQYAGEWQSETRLWGHAARTQPDAPYAHLKLGEARREAGDLEGAIHAYQRAIWLAPTRKLAHAGLFEVVARRDERFGHLSPPRARELALQYYKRIDRPASLRPWVAELLELGYVRSAELPLQVWLAYEPLPDNVLAQSAIAALRADRPTLGKFYLHCLKQPPELEPLAGIYAQPYFRVVP
jgi:tetratricopeptide (TPR) repeat protein